jgi:hypothetical protein
LIKSKPAMGANPAHAQRNEPENVVLGKGEEERAATVCAVVITVTVTGAGEDSSKVTEDLESVQVVFAGAPLQAN